MAHEPEAPSLLATGSTWRGRPVSYTDLHAADKRDYLFEAGIQASAYDPANLPDVNFGVFEFAESATISFLEHRLAQTITRAADEFETPRRKLFHTYGTTAKVRFDPAPDSPYTGLFSETGHGLVRFSYAGPVVGVGIVPGVSLKILVDGDHLSQNAVLMRTLDPQLERSVFLHPFTNILPDPSPLNLIMREVKKRFETVITDGHGLHQPVINFAEVSSTGMPVEGDVRAPYRVILLPTDDARRGHDPTLDFREDLARNVPAGTTIYTVLGLDEATEVSQASSGPSVEELVPLAQRIGALTTESEFVASAYGDYRLFFQHSGVFMR